MEEYYNLLAGSNNETNVGILAGQSWARGTNNNEVPTAPYITPNPNAQIVGIDRTNLNEVTTFEVMDYNEDNFMGNLWGIESAIAYKFNPNPFRLVKVTRGGSSLGVNWASGTAQRNALIDYINYAKNNVKNPVFHWFWLNWEGDVTDNTLSDNYEANYNDLITEILSSTGVTFKTHTISSVHTGSSFYINNTVNGDKIIAAKTNSAITYNANIIDINSTTLYDNVHCESSGYIFIAGEWYNIINQ